ARGGARRAAGEPDVARGGARRREAEVQGGGRAAGVLRCAGRGVRRDGPRAPARARDDRGRRDGGSWMSSPPPARFSADIKVRFSDVDRAGIAYYPRVIHWLHVAFEEFFEQFCGVPYATVLEKENLGFPAVDLKTEFVAPCRFGEVLTVHVSLA